ncbi:Protein of unknown function [Pyronema omphalodes CBS 100304]|uniref:Uncharacterized protein n=1 Tax=Pyronema omphalodes (strain CBS 100304) TaxID=1076935 RepID=U4LSQ1_PYROM|nr:Protein of unknown function [Pyronema omphalodes CBS 100304]
MELSFQTLVPTRSVFAQVKSWFIQPDELLPPSPALGLLRRNFNITITRNTPLPGYSLKLK